MTEYFVSTTGDDEADGSATAPFRTIVKGIRALGTPGDVLVVRGGVYPERVDVIDKHGDDNAPIVIRGETGEQVFVDGPEPLDVSRQPAGFRVAGNSEWRPGQEVDPRAHEEEYISTRAFPLGEADRVRHGAFLDRPSHTRLITYGRLDDLRAVNQRFGRLDMDDTSLPSSGDPVVNVRRTPEGMAVTFDAVRLRDTADPDHPDGIVVPKYKRPWTYLGPGLYQDCGGWLHVRLSHTTNATAGIADYDGGTDPCAVGLALSTYLPPTMKIEDCAHVRFENLNVRFGGNRTMRIDGCTAVVLDRVTVWAGAAGVFLGDGNTDVHLCHCVLDGGLPPWLFRSDIKDGYKTLTSDEEVVSNNLAKGTMDSLLSGAPANVGTVLAFCELVGAHDMALFGQGTSFHHNWVRNIHDDALIVDLRETRDLDVHHNVITKSLMALSFARTGAESIGGPRRVHRNLIDLREPTAGIRPRPEGHLVDQDDTQPQDGVYRYGQVYKGNRPDGPMDFFHNTCLVRRQNALAGFVHFRDSDAANGIRRSVNNIFVDVEPLTVGAEYATTMLPEPGFAGPSDANCHWRLGGGPPVRHLGWPGGSAATYPSLDAYRAGGHFEDSQVDYPPGFEQHGIDEDPLFRSIAPDGSPSTDDDLRLRAGSPAARSGLPLTGAPTGIIDPLAPPDGPAPDLGCYPSAADDLVLEVGVDGRWKFPQHP